MKSGYKIWWTDNAIEELRATYKYLEDHWSEKEMRNLSAEIDSVVSLISNHPGLFPISEKGNIRKVVVKKLNTLYYKEKGGNRIEILSFFSNRQNPDKRKK